MEMFCQKTDWTCKIKRMTLARKLTAKAAAARYRNPSKSLRVIAVVGPYGKTTTALLLTELLMESGNSVLVLTNKGSKLNGEPLGMRFEPTARSIQRLLALGRKKSVDFVIIEVDQTVVDSHVLESIVLEMVVATAESDVARAMLERPMAYSVVPSAFTTEARDVAPHQAISFGTDELADARIGKVKLFRKGTEIELVIDHQTTLQLATHLIGHANVYNVAAAVAAAYVLAAKIESFVDGVARLEEVPGNYEYLPLERLYSVVVDGAYQPTSLELVVADAKKLTKRRLLVVADETIQFEDYAKLKQVADAVTVVGEGEQPGIKASDDKKNALDTVLRGAKQEDTVLCLGRTFASQDSDHLSVAQRLAEGSSE